MAKEEVYRDVYEKLLEHVINGYKNPIIIHNPYKGVKKNYDNLRDIANMVKNLRYVDSVNIDKGYMEIVITDRVSFVEQYKGTNKLF